MDGQPCPTSNAQQLRVVQQLLWDVISLHLYPAERDEIRRALGPSLLDENETLYVEAGALAEILGDVQLNTAALLARHQLCSNPQRSMVETEIRLLIERLHSSAAVTPFGSAVVKERDPDSLLPRAGRRDKAVLEYVTTVAQVSEAGGRPPSSSLPPRPPSSGHSFSSRPGTTSSRPPTAFSPSASASASISLPSPLSRPGTASPTLHGSRPSTTSSAASSAATRYTDAPSVVAGLADKLNLATIDTVRETLRTALVDERAALLEDIEYLQGLLDTEAELQVRAAAPPPSLAELKDYHSRLAAVVANEESRVEHEVRVSAMFAAADQQQNKPGRLRSMVDASRRPTSSGSGSGSSAPVAAASPPGTARRSSGGGGAQTLVVHGGEEEAVRQSRQSRPSSGSSSTRAPVAAAAAASADGGVVSSRAASLATVRRPVSGGSSNGTAAAASAAAPSAFPTPPATVRSTIPLPPARVIPSSPADGGAATVLKLAKAPSSHSAAVTTIDITASGPSSASPPSSARLLHAPSPGRLRPIAAPSATGAMAPPPTLHPAAVKSKPQPQPHAPSETRSQHEKSLSLRVPPSSVRAAALAASATAAVAAPDPSTSPVTKGTGVVAVATAAPKAGVSSSAAATPGLRLALPRPGSVDRSGPGGAASAAAAVATAASSNGSSSSITSRSSGRVNSTATPGNPTSAATTVRATAAASPGSAVAARLAGAASSSSAAANELYGPPTAVQPRALLGNKQSVVEKLDEEVDKVKGGLAAILERYNLRPSTSSSVSAAATAPAAATATAVTPPPSSSRGS